MRGALLIFGNDPVIRNLTNRMIVTSLSETSQYTKDCLNKGQSTLASRADDKCLLGFRANDAPALVFVMEHLNPHRQLS